jgi:hypothetical protein
MLEHLKLGALCLLHSALLTAVVLGPLLWLALSDRMQHRHLSVSAPSPAPARSGFAPTGSDSRPTCPIPLDSAPRPYVKAARPLPTQPTQRTHQRRRQAALADERSRKREGL